MWSRTLHYPINLNFVGGWISPLSLSVHTPHTNKHSYQKLYNLLMDTLSSVFVSFSLPPSCFFLYHHHHRIISSCLFSSSQHFIFYIRKLLLDFNFFFVVHNVSRRFVLCISIYLLIYTKRMDITTTAHSTLLYTVTKHKSCRVQCLSCVNFYIKIVYRRVVCLHNSNESQPI